MILYVTKHFLNEFGRFIINFPCLNFVYCCDVFQISSKNLIKFAGFCRLLSKFGRRKINKTVGFHRHILCLHILVKMPFKKVNAFSQNTFFLHYSSFCLFLPISKGFQFLAKKDIFNVKHTFSR